MFLASGRDTFFEIISPEHLYAGAIIFGILTLFVVLVIYIYLYKKKKRFRAKTALNEIIDDWIGDLLSEDEITDLNIPPSLGRVINKPIYRQFLTDKLVNIKKNIYGSSGRNIEVVYVELGLKEDSVKKMKSHIWHIKAKGIYELYMMDQRDMYNDILKYTNNNNKFVRREAQAAIIGFAGFEGLVFLDTLTNPLLEWQQLKLIEQLQTENLTGLDALPLWLQSENKYVVQFALKLADIYQQFDAHDVIVSCLDDDAEKIRRLAIKTLGSISTAETASLLREKYAGETVANRRMILTQLADIGSDEDVTFLEHKLAEPDDQLKLEAVRALVKISSENWKLLAKHTSNNAVLDEISRQVKKEMAA